MGIWRRLLLNSTILGPSTLRDTSGSLVNVIGGDPWYNASAVDEEHVIFLILTLHGIKSY